MLCQGTAKGTRKSQSSREESAGAATADNDSAERYGDIKTKRKNKHSSEMEAIMAFKLLELSNTLYLFALLPNPNQTGS